MNVKGVGRELIGFGKSWERVIGKKETSSPAPTYLPTPEGCSIISAEGLDFQVRDGAGYDPLAVGTGQRGTRHPWMAWLSLYRGYLRMYDFGYWCISVFVYWEFFYRAA